MAVHFGYELLHAVEGFLLLQAVLLGDGEVEGGWVVAVAGSLADLLAGALGFEVGDQLVGCGILGDGSASGEGENCEVFFHGCGVSRVLRVCLLGRVRTGVACALIHSLMV